MQQAADWRFGLHGFHGCDRVVDSFNSAIQNRGRKSSAAPEYVNVTLSSYATHNVEKFSTDCKRDGLGVGRNSHVECC